MSPEKSQNFQNLDQEINNYPKPLLNQNYIV